VQTYLVVTDTSSFPLTFMNKFSPYLCSLGRRKIHVPLSTVETKRILLSWTILGQQNRFLSRPSMLSKWSVEGIFGDYLSLWLHQQNGEPLSRFITIRRLLASCLLTLQGRVILPVPKSSPLAFHGFPKFTVFSNKCPFVISQSSFCHLQPRIPNCSNPATYNIASCICSRSLFWVYLQLYIILN
jgi:hypothetical protein